jgi:hypothetical protein
VEWKLGHLAQAMVVVSAIAVTGCSGFARQAKATTEGLKVSYEVRKEEFNGLRGPLQIRVVDTRRDKEIIADFSARHPKRPSTRASGLVAMKVRETKDVFGQDFVCQSLQARMGGGRPGSSRFQDAQTRLGRVRPRGQKSLSHTYFHGNCSTRVE